MNFISKLVEVPMGLSLFLVIIGFVCKTVSHVNAARSEECIHDLSSQTGNTFAAARRILETRRPLYGILGNVPVALP